MKNKLNQLREEFLAQLAQVKNNEYLRELEIKYLSRKGELSQLMSGVKDVSAELRQEVGELANNIKQELQEKFAAVKATLNGSTTKTAIDVTLPGDKFPQNLG